MQDDRSAVRRRVQVWWGVCAFLGYALLGLPGCLESGGLARVRSVLCLAFSSSCHFPRFETNTSVALGYRVRDEVWGVRIHCVNDSSEPRMFLPGFFFLGFFLPALACSKSRASSTVAWLSTIISASLCVCLRYNALPICCGSCSYYAINMFVSLPFDVPHPLRLANGKSKSSPNVRGGVGELYFRGIVAYSAVVQGQRDYAIECVMRCSEVYVKSPGLCRFPA